MGLGRKDAHQSVVWSQGHIDDYTPTLTLTPTYPITFPTHHCRPERGYLNSALRGSVLIAYSEYISP